MALVHRPADAHLLLYLLILKGWELSVNASTEIRNQTMKWGLMEGERSFHLSSDAHVVVGRALFVALGKTTNNQIIVQSIETLQSLRINLFYFCPLRILHKYAQAQTMELFLTSNM